MHRILMASCTIDPAKVPTGFSLDDYIAKSHFEVRFSDHRIRLQVRLKKMWANLLAEAPVADDQTVSDDAEDGWSVVNATVSDTIQLRRWLHGYGAEVEVQMPSSLRDEFAAAAMAAARLYRD
jgi:predicted DNA-binding transcriptional regulator YafY